MRLQQAVALRDRNKPGFLFRYRPLSKDREFENIERQQVWLSQPIYVPRVLSVLTVHSTYLEGSRLPRWIA